MFLLITFSVINIPTSFLVLEILKKIRDDQIFFSISFDHFQFHEYRACLLIFASISTARHVYTQNTRWKCSKLKTPSRLSKYNVVQTCAQASRPNLVFYGGLVHGKSTGEVVGFLEWAKINFVSVNI